MNLLKPPLSFKVAPMTRVDKADILELTVFHLTTLHQQQRSSTMVTEAAAYSAGFKDCVREVMTYLSACKVTDVSSTNNLRNHLYQTLIKKRRLNPNEDKASAVTENALFSTPSRNNDVSFMTSSSLYTPKMSPIVSISSTKGYLRTNSCTTEPGNTSEATGLRYDSSTDSCYSSTGVSMTTNYGNTSGSEDVVVIGNGDNIGHVIKNSLWRPFEA
ncbi:hypothetical protein DPMN_086112 [Dreissena polymorpha]|uniref:Orange domain-containing protein n=1 Tax=Dreissena polymorpha TaxID=45954 RepID=A0A9D3YDU5_DREPO|nr:hypothetical protein DPMN_086112 [Dreissena polymorpha]